MHSLIFFFFFVKAPKSSIPSSSGTLSEVLDRELFLNVVTGEPIERSFTTRYKNTKTEKSRCIFQVQLSRCRVFQQHNTTHPLSGVLEKLLPAFSFHVSCGRGEALRRDPGGFEKQMPGFEALSDTKTLHGGLFFVFWRGLGWVSCNPRKKIATIIGSFIAAITR